MLIAYNNDIEFRNRWYHIQTEDNGLKDGHITTTVFYSGQILDSKSVSYLDAIAGVTDPDKQNQIIKDMMIKQHQMFYGKLNAGTYEDIVNGSPKRSAAGSSSVIRGVDKHVASSPSVIQPAPHSAEKPIIPPPSSLNTGSSSIPHTDVGTSSSIPRINKPDILRASSQQAPGISKNLDLKSLSGKSASAPQSAPYGSDKDVAPMGYAPIGYAPRLNAPQSVSSMPQANRQPSPKMPIPRSKAVEKYSHLKVVRAWRGVSWNSMDLSIDSLVALLLEESNA